MKLKDVINLGPFDHFVLQEPNGHTFTLWWSNSGEAWSDGENTYTQEELEELEVLLILPYAYTLKATLRK